MRASESYWIATSTGQVVAFGDAAELGSLSDQGVSATVITMAAAGAAPGYWLLGGDGGIFSFGKAPFLGSVHGRLGAGRVVVDMCSTPAGDGYWVLDDHGGVHAFGEAPILGDLPPLGPDVRAVRIVAHPTEVGYWILDHVGGVFSYGEANFHGALPGERMATRPADLVPHPEGEGYWVLTADGRVKGFGCWRNMEPELGFDLQRTHGLVAAVAGVHPGSVLALDRDGIVFPIGAAGFEGSLVGALKGASAIAIECSAAPTTTAAPELSFKHPLERRRYSQEA